MIALLENFHVALPELTVLIAACIALLADLFLRHRYQNIALYFASIGLAIAASMSFLFLGDYKTIIFSGLFISDDLAQLMKLFIYLSTFLSFFYAKNYLEERQMPLGDYYVLGLFSTLGMMILVSAHSLLTVFLGLELVSLPVYAMTAIRRTNSDAAEAAMKYFVTGAIASGMMLYGFSLLYGATGKLDLLDIANTIVVNWQEKNMLISFALIFIIAGVGFKLASIPFHMWAPDVYQGAPSSVTLFLSAGTKVAALGMALRLFALGLPALALEWQKVWLVMALLSIGIGNLLAITQSNIKRLLAYSAISHIGYALLGVVAANVAGYAAALYYVLIYALMSVASFGLIVLLSYKGMEVEAVNDLQGLNRKDPWIAFMMLIVMFSTAGIPPTVGFFAKLLVLKALVDAQLTWVAVISLIFAVLGAYYYLRIVKVIYFDEVANETSVQFSPSAKLIFSVNCLALLYLGIFPSGLITACINAFTN